MAIGDLARQDEYYDPLTGLPTGGVTGGGELPVDPRDFTSPWARSAGVHPGPYEPIGGSFPAYNAPDETTFRMRFAGGLPTDLPTTGDAAIPSGPSWEGNPTANRYADKAGRLAFDMAVPQSATDVGLMLTPGGMARKAVGGAIGSLFDAGEAQAGKLPRGPTGRDMKLGGILNNEAVEGRNAIRAAEYQKSVASQEKQAVRDLLANQKLAEESAAMHGAFPQYAEQYPPTGPGTPTIDPKSGKAYMAKTNTADAEAFADARAMHQRAMDTHGYEPYFDPAKRFHVDPANYPPMIDTAQHMPKTPAALLTWTERFDVPETREALQRAYASGLKVQDAEHWYMMGQLEKEYTKEFGAKVGRERFRNDFGGAMAATTGGADPTSNFLMGHYSNYLRYKGQDFPRVSPAEQAQMRTFSESQGKPYVDAKNRPIDKTGDIASYSLPFPIGGQYAAGNLDQYERVFKEVAAGKDIGKALEDANPKRLNFKQAFLGDPASFTWDKQMTAGATRGLPKQYDAPDLGYGILERVAREEAAKTGKAAQEFQGVGWAGFKGEQEAAETLGGKFQGPKGFGNVKYEGPMISHINDVVERTHRLTGMPKAEIVRRGIVRAEIPLYGLGGAMTMGALARQYDEPQGGRT